MKLRCLSVAHDNSLIYVALRSPSSEMTVWISAELRALRQFVPGDVYDVQIKRTPPNEVIVENNTIWVTPTLPTPLPRGDDAA
jgi:hypothetical protein